MSPAPVMGSVGAELYDANAPLAYADELNDWALAKLCQAIGLMWQEIADLSEDRDGRPGYAVLVDVETTPANALPWLAQIPGVRLTQGASEADQRDEVRRHAGAGRCRPAAMKSAGALTLTSKDPAKVRIVERTNSAWTLTVITSPSDTPDPAATLAAVLSQKVGGDILTFIQDEGPIIDEMSRTIDALTGTIDALTLADVS